MWHQVFLHCGKHQLGIVDCYPSHAIWHKDILQSLCKFLEKNDLKLHSIFISKYPLACLFFFFSFCNLSNFCLWPHFFSTFPTLCVSTCLLFLLLIQWFSNRATCLSRETWKPDGMS